MKESVRSCLSVVVRELEDVVDTCSEEVDVAVGDQNEHDLDGSVQEYGPVGRDQKYIGGRDSV